MIKSFEDVQDYGKQGFEAWMASATAMTKGFQAVAAETAEYSKKSFEKGTAALQEIMAAKSLDRALAVQQGFAKEAYEGFVGQLNKFGELYAAAAKEAFKPFEAQIAQFTNKVGGPK
jgi:phasin family protein